MALLERFPSSLLKVQVLPVTFLSLQARLPAQKAMAARSPLQQEPAQSVQVGLSKSALG